MTGLRAARINAGYRTAREAHAAFAKGKKGREALSLSYWQKLEAAGPKLMHPPLMKCLAQFLGCSANLIFAHTAEPLRQPGRTKTATTTKKGTSTPTQPRRPRQAAAEARQRQTKGPRAKTQGPQKATNATMTTLPHGEKP